MLIRYEEAEIRKLQAHVLDTQSHTRERFRGENIKKLFRLQSAAPDSTNNFLQDGGMSRDPDSQSYHEHLTSCLQAFRPKKWRPLTPDEVPGSNWMRCRPISARPPSAAESRLTQGMRPSSEPARREDHQLTQSQLLSVRPDTPRVSQGNHDMLSPRILSQLITDARPRTPLSTYGDVIEPPRTHRKHRKHQFESHQTANGLMWKSKRSKSVDKLVIGEENEDDESDSESDSDESIDELEKGHEPPVDWNRKAPELFLRPERLDSVYTPDSKRDLRRFDFDAEKVDIPVYEFQNPIPAPFTRLNFKFHARENSDWRMNGLGHADPTLSAMFDRLVDIGRREIETEEWEEKRMRTVRRRPQKGHVFTPTTERRDRRCCNSCLQPACVGDCPAKRGPPTCCDTCHQPLCIGTCSDTKYSDRMRHPRDDGKAALPPKPTGPRQCRSCQRKHPAKLINANNVVLGRPTSAFSTYTRGKQSAKPKSDLRPTSAHPSSDCISKGIERLGIEAVRPPSSAKPRRPRSRGDIIPGKTHLSNLSRSLTDLTPKKHKRRSKSAKSSRSGRSSTLSTSS